MMERSRVTSELETRLLDIRGVCAYLGLGRNSSLKIVNKIGAERKFGRRTLYDKKVIDQYLDELTEKEGVVL